MNGALFFAGVYLASCAALLGFFLWLCRASDRQPLPDPAFRDRGLREDRDVEALDAIWDLPTFDHRETA